MESLQLSQVLADLSNLGAADRDTASAIVTANKPIVIVEPPTSAAPSDQQNQQRPTSSMRRAWSSDPASQPQPKFDKFGRRILLNNSGSRSGSAGNSTPGTPRRGDSDFEDDLERASTLMALYDIRAKLKQQDNSSLMKAREKINSLAAKQQQQAAQAEKEKEKAAADQARKNRYSFPKTGV